MYWGIRAGFLTCQVGQLRLGRDAAVPCGPQPRVRREAAVGAVLAELDAARAVAVDAVQYLRDRVLRVRLRNMTTT